MSAIKVRRLSSHVSAYRNDSEPDASRMATTRPTACLPRTGSSPLPLLPPRDRANMLFSSSSAEAEAAPAPAPRLMDADAPSAGDFDAGELGGKGDAATEPLCDDFLRRRGSTFFQKFCAGCAGATQKCHQDPPQSVTSESQDRSSRKERKRERKERERGRALRVGSAHLGLQLDQHNVALKGAIAVQIAGNEYVVIQPVDGHKRFARARLVDADGTLDELELGGLVRVPEMDQVMSSR